MNSSMSSAFKMVFTGLTEAAAMSSMRPEGKSR